MLRPAFAALILSSSAALAEAPKVVADIAPIHSLVAQVMKGVGTPDLIMPSTASPHYYTMRPSEAGLLQSADLVVWVGEELTPWLERGLENVAADATSLELLHSSEALLLETREDAVFASADEHHDDHHDDHDGHADNKHDDHDDHKDHDDHAEDNHDDHDDHKGHDHHDEAKHDDHNDHKDHDDHGEAKHDDHDDHEDEHHHHHDGPDPHAWLSPEVAQAWLFVIADTLSEIDPGNATLYAANATLAAQDIKQNAAEMRGKLETVHGKPFIVFHDAYQYFENSMGITATGALQLSDATPPSAARLDQIRDEINEHGITCVFAEPQFNPSIVESVTNGQINSGVLDPLGAGLEPSPEFYNQLINALGQSALDCLG